MSRLSTCINFEKGSSSYFSLSPWLHTDCVASEGSLRRFRPFDFFWLSARDSEVPVHTFLYVSMYDLLPARVGVKTPAKRGKCEGAYWVANTFAGKFRVIVSGPSATSAETWKTHRVGCSTVPCRVRGNRAQSAINYSLHYSYKYIFLLPESAAGQPVLKASLNRGTS